MQADQNNYQPDKQFTDKGWNEMLKTLDKEMPVQEKKRRGFFWFFLFLSVGVIASVWAFYPTNKEVEIAEGQEVILSQSVDQDQNAETIIENPGGLTPQNIVSESKANEINNNQTNKTQTQFDDDFPSIIKSSNSLLPQVIEENIPIEETSQTEEKGPLARLEIEIHPIDPSFITIHFQEEGELNIEDKEFFFEEKKEEVIETPKPTKRKVEFGIYAGVVGDFANIKKPGLMTGASVHFPLGDKKLGLRTGLGYAQLQKELPFYFIGNQDAALSDEFIIDISLATPLPFSTVAVQSNANFILEKYHQLEIPLVLTYSPSKKIEFQFGANASYLIKDQIKLWDNNLYINNAVNSDYAAFGIDLNSLDLNSISQEQYANEDYWTKLNVSGVAGLMWKPTRRVNINLQYHHGFFPILKSLGNNESNQLQSVAALLSYEVYDNSGGLDPNLMPNQSLFENNSEKRLQREKIIKKNYSLRFSVGYNF